MTFPAIPSLPMSSRRRAVRFALDVIIFATGFDEVDGSLPAHRPAGGEASPPPLRDHLVS